jgi:hypothetical protein
MGAHSGPLFSQTAVLRARFRHDGDYARPVRLRGPRDRTLSVTRILLVTALSLAPVMAATPAHAALPKPKSYANCVALNKVYPHGVAKAATVRDKTKSAYKVRNFVVDAKTYALNPDRDRDKDGIACEKR